MIEAQELSKYYGAQKACGPLDFSIDKGEVVGLLGLNGAGKTTTLRMLASELLPTSGRLLIDGIDLAEKPEAVRARIGYLPDRPPLYDEMTVREYIDFAARLRGMSGAQLGRRVDEVIERTALGRHQDDRIDTLSHGFRQRVGIAQAIVHRPALLLLDEPQSGLDPVQIVEMRALIRSLRGEHTTVVSSHILSEISETCDRLLVLVDGRIVTEGSEEELAEKMTPGQDLRVVVRGQGSADKTAERARELIAPLAGVKKVEAILLPAEHRKAEGVAALHVNADGDVREAVAKELVRADLGLIELTRAEPELEAIFLQLAGGRSHAEKTGSKAESTQEAAQ